jgi:hypothetical protein
MKTEAYHISFFFFFNILPEVRKRVYSINEESRVAIQPAKKQVNPRDSLVKQSLGATNHRQQLVLCYWVSFKFSSPGYCQIQFPGRKQFKLFFISTFPVPSLLPSIHLWLSHNKSPS